MCARQHRNGTTQHAFPCLEPVSLSTVVLRLTQGVACIGSEVFPVAKPFLPHRQMNDTFSHLLFLFEALSPFGLQEKTSFSASSDFFPF